VRWINRDSTRRYVHERKNQSLVLKVHEWAFVHDDLLSGRPSVILIR
jgi:hypothetical protein